MLIVSIAQVQTAHIWATFALNHRRLSLTLSAPRFEHLHVTGKRAEGLFDKCNCFKLKILIIFIQLISTATVDSVVPSKLGFSFRAMRLSSPIALLSPRTAIKVLIYSFRSPLDLPATAFGWSHIMCISYPGQLQRPGIERQLSLGCAFTYQPAAFGRRPAWQMGPGTRARSGAVGDN